MNKCKYCGRALQSEAEAFCSDRCRNAWHQGPGQARRQSGRPVASKSNWRLQRKPSRG